MTKKRLLVTGGAGFIGSNFIMYILNKYPNYEIINLDKLTYAGDLANLKEVKSNPAYHFIMGDIGDRQLVEEIFHKHNIEHVINIAAESHVDRSISKPEDFVQSNITGTFVLLDVAKTHWMEKPNKYFDRYAHSRFLQVSTDEVYGTLDATGYFTEETPLAPNSPYSASKAAADMLVRSYNKTYGLNTLVTRCSNNYGPRQHFEKLIPTIIRNALLSKPIPIYGSGNNIREWLHVLDHCKGIDMVFHDGAFGEVYNIGGDYEYENLYVANFICNILDELGLNGKINKCSSLITFVSDRPGHDIRYAIDSSKVRELGWKPDETFESGIVKTVEWYLKNIHVGTS